jgi:hypothetical protein
MTFHPRRLTLVTIISGAVLLSGSASSAVLTSSHSGVASASRHLSESASSTTAPSSGATPDATAATTVAPSSQGPGLAVSPSSKSPSQLRPQQPTSRPQLNVTELAVSAAHLNLVLFGEPTIAADGSMGTNIGGWHSVGSQRDVTNHFLGALATDNAADLSRAMAALEYTFAHQNADGSWPQVDIPGSPYPPGGGFMSTIFFYASLGRSLGLAEDSHWFETSAATSALRARLAALAPLMERGLAWMRGPVNSQQMQNMGKGAQRDSNRAAAGAEGFLLVGQWLHSAADVATGQRLLLQVESNQLPDGTILEAGGFDAGYQTVSLNHLYDIWFHLYGSLAGLRGGVWNELVKGTAKENSVVLPSGQINFDGSTRVDCGGETFHGQPKQGSGQALARVEVYTAGVTGNTSLLGTAARIINYYNTHTHSHCV